MPTDKIFTLPVTMTDNPVKIINSTITRLLASREHSRYELLSKLLAIGFDEVLCEQQIDEFSQRGVQSDVRFAQSLVRSRSGKGQGELRIKAELQSHRLSEELIQQVLQEAELDWFELARQTAIKKFGGQRPDSWEKQQKYSRFLQYRGFSREQIRYALENAGKTTS